MIRSQKSLPPANGDVKPGQDSDLALESTGSQALRGLRVPTSNSSGCNPYNAVPVGANATGMHRLDDMRRLSEWIRMKRDVEREQGKKK